MSTVNRNVKFLYFAPRLSPPAPLPRARLFPRFSPPAPPSRSLARGFLCHFSLPCPTALLSAWLFWHFSSSASRHALSPRGFFSLFSLLRHATPFSPRGFFRYFSLPCPTATPPRVAFWVLSLSCAPPRSFTAWLFARFFSPEPPKK